MSLLVMLAYHIHLDHIIIGNNVYIADDQIEMVINENFGMADVTLYDLILFENT